MVAARLNLIFGLSFFLKNSSNSTTFFMNSSSSFLRNKDKVCAANWSKKGSGFGEIELKVEWVPYGEINSELIQQYVYNLHLFFVVSITFMRACCDIMWHIQFMAKFVSTLFFSILLPSETHKICVVLKSHKYKLRKGRKKARADVCVCKRATI